MVKSDMKKAKELRSEGKSLSEIADNLGYKEPEIHGCSGCKHLNKKITESPCDMCDPWGNMWEEGNGDE